MIGDLRPARRDGARREAVQSKRGYCPPEVGYVTGGISKISSSSSKTGARIRVKFGPVGVAPPGHMKGNTHKGLANRDLGTFKKSKTFS